MVLFTVENTLYIVKTVIHNIITVRLANNTQKICVVLIPKFMKLFAYI